MSEFGEFQAISFDCYGTLIDWEAGIVAQLVPWADKHGVDASADELMSVFASIETDVETEQAAALYPTVLALTLDRVAERFGVKASADERAAFGASVGSWPAFEDSAESLARLKQRYKLIILSNVDRKSFAVSRERLGVDFDLVITAEDVGAYKPSAKSFPALIAALPSIGVTREQLLHVAQSLFHDHEPARAMGLPSVWIDRRHGTGGFGATPPPRAGTIAVDWRFTSLQEFADAALAARDDIH